MSGPLFAFPLKDNTYRIIDGDTVEVLLDRGWRCTKLTSIRLIGLDTPECRTRRALEKQAGLLAKELVVCWFNSRKDKQHFYATSDAKPKYAGRTVGRIWAGDASDCLNDYMLNLKVAKPYMGGRKEKFTDEELNVVIEICNKELERVKQLGA